MKIIAAIIAYPAAGALFALGALGVAYYAGSAAIRPLGRSAGRSAGEGFAEGMAAFNAAKLAATDLLHTEAHHV